MTAFKRCRKGRGSFRDKPKFDARPQSPGVAKTAAAGAPVHRRDARLTCTSRASRSACQQPVRPRVANNPSVSRHPPAAQHPLDTLPASGTVPAVTRGCARRHVSYQ
ncbi:feline leukemia virus subgroup C receptor-related protein 2 [Striga asiatica]|uniref:Feline leukemia virus subgroup C receptor-related protein 2 n=1 Tax=Striga asiatica TaxID=4170 RepID=A0A5A7PGZ9_STRAF|nr:feline leukemia virus subgroup C receptor-related protein 2 [Striga asiatica]